MYCGLGRPSRRGVSRNSNCFIRSLPFDRRPSRRGVSRNKFNDREKREYEGSPLPQGRE